MAYVYAKDKSAEYLHLKALQKIGFQGFPQAKGLHTELINKLEKMARYAMEDFGRCILPWMHWLTPEEAEQRMKDELGGDLPQLAEAWVRAFEPHNLELYRAQGAFGAR